MSNPVIMLAGLPGTGKSTIAEKLEDRLADYDVHSVLGVRRDFGYRIYNPQSSIKVLRNLFQRVEESLRKGLGVILDSTFAVRTTPNNLGRQRVYEVATDYSADVLIIECYCSEREAKTRMRERPKSDGLVVDARNPKAYDKLSARWQDIGEDFKLFPSVPISYLKYNTEINDVQEVQVNPNVRLLVDKIKEIIKS